MDSAGRFVPTTPEVPAPDRRGLCELTVGDLTGPVVFIDSSARPSGAEKEQRVTAVDIDAIADRLANRSFVIAHTGWSRFWGTSGPGLEGPYVNGFNFPGCSKAAIGRLIEIEPSRIIGINGVGADNLAIDVGENANVPIMWLRNLPGGRDPESRSLI